MKRLVGGVASEERLVSRCSVAEVCGRYVWHSKGGTTHVFKIARLNALAIAFGKRQHRICEVKGARGYARTNVLIAIHRVDAGIESIHLGCCG